MHPEPCHNPCLVRRSLGLGVPPETYLCCSHLQRPTQSWQQKIRVWDSHVCKPKQASLCHGGVVTDQPAGPQEDAHPANGIDRIGRCELPPVVVGEFRLLQVSLLGLEHCPKFVVLLRVRLEVSKLPVDLRHFGRCFQDGPDGHVLIGSDHGGQHQQTIWDGNAQERAPPGDAEAVNSAHCKGNVVNRVERWYEVEVVIHNLKKAEIICESSLSLIHLLVNQHANLPVFSWRAWQRLPLTITKH
mmetsp:Transcript_4113/g.7352  ORF Transcript_4113/g.7352 Transcript_4113/m.7352 type:complete len:244 (+) Transcript_4113:789-1520(+)